MRTRVCIPVYAFLFFKFCCIHTPPHNWGGQLQVINTDTFFVPESQQTARLSEWGCEGNSKRYVGTSGFITNCHLFSVRLALITRSNLINSENGLETASNGQWRKQSVLSAAYSPAVTRLMCGIDWEVEGIWRNYQYHGCGAIRNSTCCLMVGNQTWSPALDREEGPGSPTTWVHPVLWLFARGHVTWLWFRSPRRIYSFLGTSTDNRMRSRVTQCTWLHCSLYEGTRIRLYIIGWKHVQTREVVYLQQS